MIKKIFYRIISVLILVYSYYLFLIMDFNSALIFGIIGGFFAGRVSWKAIDRQEIEVRYYSTVYRHYFAYDRKQVEEFDTAITDLKMDLTEACDQFDIQKEVFLVKN